MYHNRGGGIAVVCKISLLQCIVIKEGVLLLLSSVLCIVIKEGVLLLYVYYRRCCAS